jgi:hypothetical protein
MAMKAGATLSSDEEHDDHNYPGALSVSLATSLGSLKSSVHPETYPFPVQRIETLSFVRDRLDGSPMVAVRRDSLATLLKAFDEILLSSTT